MSYVQFDYRQSSQRIAVTRLITGTFGIASLGMCVCAVSAAILTVDRTVDWSAYPPGPKGGIVERTTIFTNLTSLDNTGTTAVDAILNAVLAVCPSNQVVYLPAGRFRCTNAITLQSYVTLRGAGPTNTILEFDNQGAADGLWCLKAHASDYPFTQSNNITSGATKGSTSLTLETTTGLKAGGFALVDHLNPEFVTNGVIEGYSYLSRLSGTRLMGQLIEVLSVDGNTITFTPPLAWWYTNNGQVVALPTWKRAVGVEDLTVTNVMASEPANGSGQNIRFSQAVDSWIKNVNSRRCVQYHVYLLRSFRCAVRDSDFRDAFTYQSSRAYGVDVLNQSTANLIENNLSDHCLISYTSEGSGPWNVWGYNYAHGTTNSGDGLIRALNVNHGGAPHMNLFEGNVVNAIGADLLHGGSCHNTLFRNWSKGWQPNASAKGTNYYQRAISINKGNWYYNVVGNVLGDPRLDNATYGSTWTYAADVGNTANSRPFVWRLGFVGAGDSTLGLDSAVVTNTFRHGNFDFANSSVVDWQVGHDTTLPASLYLSAKPAWWGALAWPAIGPDVPGLTNAIPAQARFLNTVVTMPTRPPLPPTMKTPK